ncbi:MAG: hypothetical protein ACKOET_07630, partial [Verrucomicrobiota bacterium]
MAVAPSAVPATCPVSSPAGEDLGGAVDLRPAGVRALVLLAGWVGWVGWALTGQAANPDLVLRDGLALALGGRQARAPFRVDPVEAQMVRGQWRVPAAGDVVSLPGGTNRLWEPVRAGADGTFQHPALRGGYFSVPLVAPADGIWLLRASGHTMAYVNGEPRAGDIYRNGSVSLPVAIHRGTNDLLFATGRGPLSVVLAEPEKPISIDTRDTT